MPIHSLVGRMLSGQPFTDPDLAAALAATDKDWADELAGNSHLTPAVADVVWEVLPDARSRTSFAHANPDRWDEIATDPRTPNGALTAIAKYHHDPATPTWLLSRRRKLPAGALRQLADRWGHQLQSGQLLDIARQLKSNTALAVLTQMDPTSHPFLDGPAGGPHPADPADIADVVTDLELTDGPSGAKARNEQADLLISAYPDLIRPLVTQRSSVFALAIARSLTLASDEDLQLQVLDLTDVNPWVPVVLAWNPASTPTVRERCVARADTIETTSGNLLEALAGIDRAVDRPAVTGGPSTWTDPVVCATIRRRIKGRTLWDAVGLAAAPGADPDLVADLLPGTVNDRKPGPSHMVMVAAATAARARLGLDRAALPDPEPVPHRPYQPHQPFDRSRLPGGLEAEYAGELTTPERWWTFNQLLVSGASPRDAMAALGAFVA